MSHKGVSNVNADVPQLSGTFFGNRMLARLSGGRLELGGIQSCGFDQSAAVGVLFQGRTLSGKFPGSYWSNIVNAQQQYCGYPNQVPKEVNLKLGNLRYALFQFEQECF